MKAEGRIATECAAFSGYKRLPSAEGAPAGALDYKRAYSGAILPSAFILHPSAFCLHP